MWYNILCSLRRGWEMRCESANFAGSVRKTPDDNLFCSKATSKSGWIMKNCEDNDSIFTISLLQLLCSKATWKSGWIMKNCEDNGSIFTISLLQHNRTPLSWDIVLSLALIVLFTKKSNCRSPTLENNYRKNQLKKKSNYRFYLVFACCFVHNRTPLSCDILRYLALFADFAQPQNFGVDAAYTREDIYSWIYLCIKPFDLWFDFHLLTVIGRNKSRDLI